jgi:hypothetical protein
MTAVVSHKPIGELGSFTTYEIREFVETPSDSKE